MLPSVSMTPAGAAGVLTSTVTRETEVPEGSYDTAPKQSPTFDTPAVDMPSSVNEVSTTPPPLIIDEPTPISYQRIVPSEISFQERYRDMITVSASEAQGKLPLVSFSVKY